VVDDQIARMVPPIADTPRRSERSGWANICFGDNMVRNGHVSCPAMVGGIGSSTP